MCTRLCLLVLIVLVPALPVSTLAADIAWTGGGADSLWSTTANWDSGLPTDGDDAYVNSDPGVLIDASVSAEALDVIIGDSDGDTGRATMTGGSLTVHKTGGGGPGLWVGNRGTGYLDMSGGALSADNVYAPRNAPGQGYITLSGGTITTGNTFTLGLHHNEYGELIMTGGVIEVGSMFRCSDIGAAYLHMLGGSINVAGTFYVVRRGNNGGSNTYGHVQLDGGTITVEDFQMDAQNSGRPATMDVTAGKLVITTDKTGIINIYVFNGWITGYGGSGEVNVDLVDGETVITATPGPQAWHAAPEEGATGVPLDADISWSAGLNATAHEVYFGSSFDDVNDATDPNIPPGRGRQDANSYDPGPLELGQTYYWRIDELSEAGGSDPWRGDVWSFDTPEYFVVDDFEDYNNYSPDTVWDTWIDGYEVATNGGMAGYDLGASVDEGENYMETVIVQGGQESMPFFYDNTGEAAHSQVVRTFAAPRDWTTAGVRALSLWFYGNLDNTVDRMYVALEDGQGALQTVYYDDPNSVIWHAWQQWNIDLARFSDLGVDLANVAKIYIGVGEEGQAPGAGGKGRLFIDSLRLYPSRCIPEYAPAGDLDGDCDVDYSDLNLLLDSWLESFTWDTTGGFDGNGCLELDGAGDRIFVPAAPFPRDAFTYSIWFKPDELMDADSGRQDLIYWSGGGPAPGARPALVHNIDGSGRLRASIMLDTMASGEQGLAFTDSRSFEPSTWYHAAFAFDGDTTQVYVNGNWENTLNFSGIHQQRYTPGVYFGASTGGANAFDGRLDDIRIYDYALSSAGVADLANAAGEPAPGPVAWYKLDEAGSGNVADSSGNGYDGYVLFVSPYANPYDDNEIGIKDFAVLAETWLEKDIWP